MTDTMLIAEMPEASKERRTLDVMGMTVEVVAGAETTEGAYALYRIETPAGVGTPHHVQNREDEAFFVLDGTFEVIRDGETVVAGPGAYVMIPRGVAHAFRNVGDETGRLLGIASPAGHERFFEDVDALGATGAPRMEDILAVCRRHGVDILPG